MALWVICWRTLKGANLLRKTKNTTEFILLFVFFWIQCFYLHILFASTCISRRLAYIRQLNKLLDDCLKMLKGAHKFVFSNFLQFSTVLTFLYCPDIGCFDNSTARDVENVFCCVHCLQSCTEQLKGNVILRWLSVRWIILCRSSRRIFS